MRGWLVGAGLVVAAVVLAAPAAQAEPIGDGGPGTGGQTKEHIGNVYYEYGGYWLPRWDDEGNVECAPATSSGEAIGDFGWCP